MRYRNSAADSRQIAWPERLRRSFDSESGAAVFLLLLLLIFVVADVVKETRNCIQVQVIDGKAFKIDQCQKTVERIPNG